MNEFRLGRHNKNLVYRQLDPAGPGDDDVLFAVIVSDKPEEDAAELVACLNDSFGLPA